MAIEPKRVVVIQDASKELNLRVFYWIVNGLSLKSADMVTLLAILHEVYTPMGYRSTVNNSLILGANQRIIDEQLARKKGEYLQHEGLARVAKLYESNKVSFKIQIFTGSSPKDVALKESINLKATWVILDRQMKKDEEFFLQKLSCGISRLRRNNRIVRLRGPLDLAVEIQCNSHETFDESLPECPYEDLFGDVVPESPIKVNGVNQIHCRQDEEEGCSTFTTNINEKPCQTSPDHPAMEETDINTSQTIGNTEGDKQFQNQGQIQSMPLEDMRDTTLVINNDQATTQEITDQLSQDVEKTHNFFHDEDWDLRHRTKSKEMIDQTKDDQLIQNQAQQTQGISHVGILDGQQEKNILENSLCIMCSVCKNRRLNIEWQKEFTYEELQAATDGFSLKNCLSECGYPFSTCRGQLEGEMKIVVKQHEITNPQVREKIKSEVQTILKARHKNVVMLLGSTTKDHFLLIVYEYACNGSLDKYLSRESCRPLTWSERLRVAIGLARGLKYLHDNNIIHGNIKPSNILLTHDFKPLLGDFGFGKKLELMSHKNKIGKSEYIAPEYQEKGTPSTKTDVYSFGVVILELITGHKATDKISGEKTLVGWAKPLLAAKKYSELVDPIVRNSYEDDQLRWLVQVTAQCLKKKPKERLSMNMVVSALQGIEDSEQCHITEDITPATSSSGMVPDMNGSQVQATNTIQGIADSKKCYMTEDFTLAVSHSRSVQDINGSQGPEEADQPGQNEDQIESSSFGEERSLRLRVENNHFYMMNQPGNSDALNQIEEQMHSRPRGEEMSSGKMRSDHMMDQTVVDQLSEFEEHMKSTLNGEGISTQTISINHMIDQTKVDQVNQDQEEEKSFVQMERGLRPAPMSGMIDQTQLQSSSHDNLLDGNQGEIILENSKSSVCSICKSKRPSIAWMKDFLYDDLLEATEGFSVKNSLSESEDGPTFKGLLDKKVKIVVKKYQITRSEEEQMFKSEVQLLTNVRHKNVVLLLGLCTDKSQLMIVYEQVCNGSLDHFLSRGNFQSLTWKERMEVAVGTARGLKYLHGNNIIHGNIKSSNILLTHDFQPLIGDFGFGKMKLEPKKSYKNKNVRDSGYIAPEYLDSGKLSTKADVYSLGVVLLELITGRRATDKLPGGKSLVGWARPLLGGKKYLQLVDPKISNSYDDEQLLWLVQVTEQCLRKNSKDRFTMNMVVSALQGIAESNECCVIEDSSPEKPYLPHDEPAMTSSQGNLGKLQHEGMKEGLNINQMIGQMKADPVSRKQGWIDRNTNEEERSFRLEIKTDHMIGQNKDDQLKQDGEEMQSRPHGEEMSRVTIISNHIIEQMKPDQQIQSNQQHIKESFCIDEIDKQQKVSKDEKQMQGKIILENSKPSLCSICKSRRPNNGCEKTFTYEELQSATEGFSIMYSLSEGEYGPAFRGQLDNKLKIVVKKHEFTSFHEEKMFMSEVQLLTNARHENLIMLLGSCIRENQLLTVYEHACNGSLDKYLSRASVISLTWRERVKIAVGVSRGLKYLHDNHIIHGRMKPSNILLNHDFNAMIGDFVFGKERNEFKNSLKDKSTRNCGYTAPECQESGKLSTKADVYSFGAVLLELITGCMISEKVSRRKCLIEWARPLLGGRKYLQLVDPQISSSCDEQELTSLVQITEKCLRKNPKERFTMNMVVSAMPCVVDSNDIYVTEESSSEKSYVEIECSASDVTGSKVKDELLEEEEEEDDLGSEISEERDENITCSRSNSVTVTDIGQVRDNYTTCGESCEETQEKESTSTKVCLERERWESYGGARDFFLEGAQEYTVCEELFSLCNSI